MRSVALAGVMAILVVTSLGAGYLAGTGVRVTETQTVTSTTTGIRQTETQTVTSTTTIATTVTSTAQSTATITNFTPSIETPLGSVTEEMSYNCTASASPEGPMVATLTALNMGSTPVIFVFDVQGPPQLSAEALGCSYMFIRVGDANGTEHDYTTLKLNFSASSTGWVAGQNLTVSSTNNDTGTPTSSFSILFEAGDFTMYLNAQPLTPWYSDPPCTQGGASTAVIDDCLVPQANSIIAELPASFQNGQYQLTLYDTSRLYP